MKKLIINSPESNHQRTPDRKKLVQARLPFKILSSPASVETPVKQQPSETATEKDKRKRKLSTETDLPAPKILCSSDIKENLSNHKDDAIVISDEESINNDIRNSDEEAIECNVDDDAVGNKNQVTTPKTVKNLNKLNTSSSSKTASKNAPFTIKLPISSKKKRKLSQKVEELSKKNDGNFKPEDKIPEKKFKVYSEEARDGKDAPENDMISNIKDDETTLSDNICLQVTMSQDNAVTDLDSKKNQTNPLKSPFKPQLEKISNFKISEYFKGAKVNLSSTIKTNKDVEINNEKDPEIQNKKAEKNARKSSATKCKSQNDNSAAIIPSEVNSLIEKNENIGKHELEESTKNNSKDNVNENNPNTPAKMLTNTPKLRNKSLTPKQLEKQKEREEKQKQKEEEKLLKQKEKEEKELLRKKEKEEKEEQRRREKEEKEEQKRREKEEKEKKRLAELEAKNEERRQKEDEKRKKEEERKKKEEERKRKELEKEEAENKKRKAAEAFTKFFVQQKLEAKEPEEDQSSEDSDKFKCPTFMPFQVKGHMKLAPVFRRLLDIKSRTELEEFLSKKEQSVQPAELYLSLLKSGKICPGKDTKTWISDDDNASDCLLIEDELEGAGQTIVEVNKPVQKHRAKFLYFHENQRPPYYGTWRKTSTCVKPRRPFATDTVFFDYEVDSDDEWEEEEPGESLHGSDDEKESEDDYEVDNEFFVPHGHLSDEELQNEDEVSDDNSPEIQKAKLKLLQQQFAQEMKKKTEKIKPRLVGPLWQDENGNASKLCPEKIWQSLNKRAMILCEPLLIIDQEKNETESLSPSQEKKMSKKMRLDEKQIKDLIRLVHGNRGNKQFMIKEFQAFLAKQTPASETAPVEYQKSTIREQIDKIAAWKVIEHTVKKKKKKKLCWLVLPDILKQYDMEGLSDNNKWEYTLEPNKNLISPVTVNSTEETVENVSSFEGREDESIHMKKKENKKNLPMITKFTTVVSKDDKLVNEKNVNKSVEISTNASPTKISSVESIDQKNDSSPNLVSKPIKGTSAPVIKKRVPLLMSVPRGQPIPENSKNAIIKDFLKKKSDTTYKDPPSSPPPDSSKPMEVDTIVID